MNSGAVLVDGLEVMASSLRAQQRHTPRCVQLCIVYEDTYGTDQRWYVSCDWTASMKEVLDGVREGRQLRRPSLTRLSAPTQEVEDTLTAGEVSVLLGCHPVLRTYL